MRLEHVDDDDDELQDNMWHLLPTTFSSCSSPRIPRFTSYHSDMAETQVVISVKTTKDDNISNVHKYYLFG